MENIQADASTLVARPISRPAPQESFATPTALRRVNNYRLAVGWVLLIVWLGSVLALDWDGQWHILVGRDGFWTPPHWMLYSTAALAGVICAGVVLLETYLYYRRYPGFNDETTTPVLWVFHGPVGFMLTGFGMLVMLCSAPLDDYWHRLFGIDVVIWSPFHVMLFLGMVMASLGLVYLFASEYNRRKKLATPRPTPTTPLARVLAELRTLITPASLGLVIATLLLLTRYHFLMGETLIGKYDPIGTLQIGTAKLPSYSLVLMFAPVLLVMLANVTGRFGIATLAGLIFVLFRLLDTAFSNWGVDYLAVQQGTRLRNNEVLDGTVVVVLFYPAFLFLAGFAVDLIYLLTRRYRDSLRLRPKLLVAGGAGLAAGLILYLLDKPWEFFNERYRALGGRGALFNGDYWAAAPLVAVLAVLAGIAGLAFATSLRYTER